MHQMFARGWRGLALALCAAVMLVSPSSRPSRSCTLIPQASSESTKASTRSRPSRRVTSEQAHSPHATSM